MKMQTLKDLYIDELKDVYDAENQIAKALPKMAKEATNEELRAAIEQHLDQTQTQIERLEQIFEELGEKAKGTKCEATKGLIEEAKRMMDDAEDEDVRDAAIIGSAQKVEHYEIAAYGTLRTYAELLGFDEQAELLQETLDEEKEADELLSQIAESSINPEAASEEEGSERSRGTGSSSQGSRTSVSARAKKRPAKRSRDKAKSRR
jgi:ferritin-like metal-binding protein YciE